MTIIKYNKLNRKIYRAKYKAYVNKSLAIQKKQNKVLIQLRVTSKHFYCVVFYQNYNKPIIVLNTIKYKKENPKVARYKIIDILQKLLKDQMIKLNLPIEDPYIIWDNRYHPLHGSVGVFIKHFNQKNI